MFFFFPPQRQPIVRGRAEQTCRCDGTGRASDTTGRRRTRASSAAGSVSPGRPRQMSLWCSSAGRGRRSRCRSPQTPEGGRWSFITVPPEGAVMQENFFLCHLSPIPRCRWSCSTAGWQRWRRCARTHRCCCRRPHTHSRENIPAEEEEVEEEEERDTQGEEKKCELSVRLTCRDATWEWAAAPTPRGPAGGRLRPTRCVLLLGTLPGSPSSSGCCSSSLPEGNTKTGSWMFLFLLTSLHHLWRFIYARERNGDQRNIFHDNTFLLKLLFQ